jgi:hypothetical protein
MKVPACRYFGTCRPYGVIDSALTSTFLIRFLIDAKNHAPRQRIRFA